MSFYDGLSFFILLFLVCIPAVILGILGKSNRLYLLGLSLLVVIWVLFVTDPIQILYLSVYLLFEWHIIALFQSLRKKYGKNKVLYFHAIIFALIPLAIAKCSPFVGHHWFSFVGISYITFKVIQIIIESYDGLVDRSNFIDTMIFFLFFPTFSSGPIDRSRRFENDLHIIKARDEYLDMFGVGLQKIFTGVLYKFVISAIAYEYLQAVTGRYSLLYVILYAYLYGIYLFFDFAGYSLMAIGTGYIFGIRTPDNFNKPFLSIDINDFWNRWHISLSHWFRDFVFSRFMMWSIRGKKFKNRLNAASAGFIVNMLLMGAWHGLSFDYLLYGLYHGLLLAGTERFQKTGWYKVQKNKKSFKIASWFVTLNLVMFGFLIFSGYFMETMRVLISKF